MNKKKIVLISILIVVVIAAAIFIFKKKKASAVTNVNKTNLLNTYAGKPKEIAAINSISDDDLNKWAAIVAVWTAGKDPYSIAQDGVSQSSPEMSIGEWWNGFKASQGFQ